MAGYQSFVNLSINYEIDFTDVLLIRHSNIYQW